MSVLRSDYAADIYAIDREHAVLDRNHRRAPMARRVRLAVEKLLLDYGLAREQRQPLEVLSFALGSLADVGQDISIEEARPLLFGIRTWTAAPTTMEPLAGL